jgi:hypothetical protein
MVTIEAGQLFHAYWPLKLSIVKFLLIYFIPLSSGLLVFFFISTKEFFMIFWTLGQCQLYVLQISSQFVACHFSVAF